MLSLFAIDTRPAYPYHVVSQLVFGASMAITITACRKNIMAPTQKGEHAMSNLYTEANTREREHLMALATCLTEEELLHPLPSGWTVAGILAHLAFWDMRAITLLHKWKEHGISPSPLDIDTVNESMRIHCISLAPRVAVQLAIDAAVAIDREIENLDATMLHRVETEGTTVHLDRAAHRRDHLGRIEQELGKSRG